MHRMKSPNPTGSLGQRWRLTDGSRPDHVAQTHVPVQIFEEQRNFTSAGIGVCAQTSRSEFRQWLENATIDLSFIRDIASMPVRVMALPGLIFDEHAPPAAICQFTSDDLVRKCAHKRRQAAIEDPHWFLSVSAQGGRQPECQSLMIRQQRNWSFQDTAVWAWFSHGNTGFRFSNHLSISANASQPQDACS